MNRPRCEKCGGIVYESLTGTYRGQLLCAGCSKLPADCTCEKKGRKA